MTPGDALIRAFAEVLVETVPAAAVVARLGGDEFGVLVEGEDVDGESLLRAVRGATARRGATGGVAAVGVHGLGLRPAPRVRGGGGLGGRRAGRAGQAPPPGRAPDRPIGRVGRPDRPG